MASHDPVDYLTTQRNGPSCPPLSPDLKTDLSSTSLCSDSAWSLSLVQEAAPSVRQVSKSIPRTTRGCVVLYPNTTSVQHRLPMDEDKLIPALAARSITKVVGSTVVENVIRNLLPRILAFEGVVSLGEMSNGLLQELDLISPLWSVHRSSTHRMPFEHTRETHILVLPFGLSDPFILVLGESAVTTTKGRLGLFKLSLLSNFFIGHTSLSGIYEKIVLLRSLGMERSTEVGRLVLQVGRLGAVGQRRLVI